MPFAPDPKDAQVSLSVFGGLVTEMAPANLPEGVSPDCQDVVFVPGSVASRPALQKVFATAFPQGGPLNISPTVTYAKSFVTPTGQIENLYLDSNGALWWEDLTNNPGVYSQIATTVPAKYAKSITAFGREYIAISDGLHGADVPLQWDGTNLDRVTQDGPGAAPTAASIALPAVSMSASGTLVLTLTESDPAGEDETGSFTRINTWTSTAVTNLQVGNAVTISGYSGTSAPMNGTWTVLAIYSGTSINLVVLSAYLPSTTVFSVAAATGTVSTGTMVRQGNTVTVNCSSAHQLQVGYQAQIAGVPASTVGGGISSISIVNEDSPGIATVTTNSAHGLIPGIFVSISGVAAVVVGGGIASITRAGQVVSVATNTAHGLSPGAVITITGVTPTSFNTTVTVLNVMSTTTFTFAQVDVNASGAGGTITINWPISDTSTPSYFEVISAPTATTFQVTIYYSNGSWASGTVSYAWNGTFFVSAVPTTTSFQYQQYGPNASTNSVGTVTPYGQAAPGLHQVQVHFLTRQGYITRPSPPATFVATGGQYVSVSNIPVGPTNVVARILAFTGAGGASFFYIPSSPQVNGQIVGTATQVNDNTTTSVLLDFSDPTLFASLGTSITGNDLTSQIVLDGALGFGFYGSRLIAWGQRNRLQNLLNMGFDGGYLPTTSTMPTGWTAATAGAGGALATGHYGQGWQTSGTGSIYQSFYRDAYGAPIGTANTTYLLRAWVKGAGSSVTVTISSVSTAFSSTATINGTTAGVFGEAAFSLAMPASIPADMILSLAGAGGALVDELSIIYAENPYLDSILYASYVDNPEGFDGITGKFGPSQDAHKLMDLGVIRQTLYLFTQDPCGRVHQTSDNGTTEPAGWTVFQVAANCGLLSAFALTKSQADDSSASGGEEWLAWAGSSGARIFGGDQPFKISQEIEPDWELINPAYNISAWTLNDPAARVIYFGLPLTGNPQGAANRIYTLNYRGLNTAHEIGTTGPIRIGPSGKLIATDHARKWTRWNLLLNGAALMFRQAGILTPILFGGNGTILGTLAGTGNVYTLNPAKLTDDDYGRIYPYYVTYFMVSHDQEQALKLGGGRKLLVYLSAFISGVGTLTITPLCDMLANAWAIHALRTLVAAPTYDLEWGGGNTQAQRIALKFASSPAQGQTDNGFNLQKITAWMRRVAHLPVRGSV